MKQSLSYLFLCLIIFASCSSKMTTTLIKAQAPLEEDVEVKVLPPEAQAPESAVVLETITLVGLDYDQLVEMAKDQARQAGGNVLQIVKHLSPDISCPRNRMAAVALSTCDSLSTDAGSPQSFASVEKAFSPPASEAITSRSIPPSGRRETIRVRESYGT